jgi:hypothetical protein
MALQSDHRPHEEVGSGLQPTSRVPAGLRSLIGTIPGIVCSHLPVIYSMLDVT